MAHKEKARIQIYNALHALTCENVKNAIETKQSILNDTTYPKFLALLQELEDVTRGTLATNLVNIRYKDENHEVSSHIQIYLDSNNIVLHAYGLPDTIAPVRTEFWPPKKDQIS